MLENFFKSLKFLGVASDDMAHVEDEKNLYKFNDPLINKHWLCFYAFYKTGYNDACNQFAALAVRQIKQ